MKEYSQLTLSQRYEIGALKKPGHRQQRIAEIVEPHPSTISRELRRNKSSNGYYPRAAHEQAQQRHLHKRRAYKWTGHWGRIIERKLRLQWSPEQISGWLFCQHHFSLSQERIYHHIRADRAAGGSLHTHLRLRLDPHRSKKATDYKGGLPNRISIDDRPPIVEEKTRIGDWEGDLMMGGQGGGALATLVDRKNRWARLQRVHTKQADQVADILIEGLKDHREKVQTLTVDKARNLPSMKKSPKP